MGRDIHLHWEKWTSEIISLGPKSEAEKRDEDISTILDNKTREPRWVSIDSWEQENPNWYRKALLDCGRNGLIWSILNKKSTPGLPDTVSSGTQESMRQWRGDYHSPSYVTLSDLLDCNWGGSMFEKSLLEIANTHGAESVRCIIFFDN